MLEKTNNAFASVKKFFITKARAVCLSMFIVLVAVAVYFMGLGLNSVSVVEGKKVFKLYTLKSNIGDIVSLAGFGEDYDVVSSEKTGNKLTINVKKTFPVFITYNDEDTVSVTCSECTVSEALEKAGITLGENDTINVDLDEILFEETYLDIVTTTVYSDMSAGRNESPVSTPVVKNISAPANVSVRSISTLSPASELVLDQNGLPINYSGCIKVQATAYTYTGRNCATGIPPQPGYIAVNPNIIPYGTRMYIVSADGRFNYGYAVAADTGGFVTTRPTNVDLFMGSYAECSAFGRRDVIIYFLD